MQLCAVTLVHVQINYCKMVHLHDRGGTAAHWLRGKTDGAVFFVFLAGMKEEDLTNMPLIVLTMRLLGLLGPTLKILVENTQLEAGNFMQNGILTKETTMTHGTTMTHASTGITEVIHMSKTSGSTATDSGRERGRGNGLNPIATEITRGGQLNVARVPRTPGVRRVLEHLPPNQKGCRVIQRGGSTAGHRIAVEVAALCLLHDTTSLTKPVWNVMQKTKKQRRRELLSRRELTKTNAW